MLKAILISVDNSGISETISTALNTLRIESKTKIIFTHVIPYTEIDEAVEHPHPLPESTYQNIERQLYACQAKYPNSEVEIVRGDAAEEIIRLANIYQVDLIVLGNRGLKGLKRIIAGSVSSQVVADASCSVFVVKLTE